MVDIIDPRRIEVKRVEEFVQDLKDLKAKIDRPLADLKILLTRRQLERGSREPVPIHISFVMIKDALDKLEAQMNTVKKEKPKVLASLQVAAELKKVA